MTQNVIKLYPKVLHSENMIYDCHSTGGSSSFTYYLIKNFNSEMVKFFFSMYYLDISEKDDPRNTFEKNFMSTFRNFRPTAVYMRKLTDEFVTKRKLLTGTGGSSSFTYYLIKNFNSEMVKFFFSMYYSDA
jgi:hypothetical protein